MTMVSIDSSAGFMGIPSGADVLVQTEEIRRVVLPLERLQPLVLRFTVRLAYAVLAFLHQEVDVDAGVVGRERGPVGARPLALLLEALGALGVAVDVERIARLAPVERGLLVAHLRHRAPHLPERDAGHRRGDAIPELRHDVDHAVAQSRDVAGPHVVPPAVAERWIE